MAYTAQIRRLLQGTGYQNSFTDWEGVLDRAVTPILDDSNFRSIYQTESAVVAPGNEKVAALCYDRVWGVALPQVGFVGRSSSEVALLMAQILSGRLGKQSPQITLEIKTLLAGIYRNTQKMGSCMFGSAETDDVLRARVRWLAAAVGNELQIPVMPAYESSMARDSDYQLGDHQILIPVLTDLDIASNELLEWPQIIEFRSDKDAQKKYRRLVHWLDAEMVGKPLSFIEDEIALKLEDYLYAMRKHGVKIVLGSISSVLDWKHLTAAVATSLSAGVLTGDALWGALAAGAITIGKVGVHVAQSALSLDDVRRGPGSEVAFVHEVTKLVNKN